MRTLRVYADTSVFGGCFDEEFDKDSLAFFREVADGRFILVVSLVTLRELRRSPANVQKLLEGLPSGSVELVEDSPEIGRLRDAYVQAGVVTATSLDDAEHIASASVAEVDVVVSWNFRHIVHFDKIRGYEAVNLLQGYRAVRIHSPREVINL
jgi:hypothetical protein